MNSWSRIVPGVVLLLGTPLLIIPSQRHVTVDPHTGERGPRVSFPFQSNLKHPAGVELCHPHLGSGLMCPLATYFVCFAEPSACADVCSRVLSNDEYCLGKIKLERGPSLAAPIVSPGKPLDSWHMLEQSEDCWCQTVAQKAGRETQLRYRPSECRRRLRLARVRNLIRRNQRNASVPAYRFVVRRPARRSTIGCAMRPCCPASSQTVRGSRRSHAKTSA